MASLVGKNLYRFQIVQDTSMQDDIVVLQAVDPFTSEPVQILQWVPPTNTLPHHRERLSSLDDTDAEVFSDEHACYAVVPNGSDVDTVLRALRTHGLFVPPERFAPALRPVPPGPGADTTPAPPPPQPAPAPAPADVPKAAATSGVAEPNGAATSAARSRDGSGKKIAAGLAIAAALIALAWGAYAYAERQAQTRRAAEEQAQIQRDLAAKAQAEEEARKKQEAEAAAKKLEAEQQATELARFGIAAFPPGSENQAIRLPAAMPSGEFFVGMTQDSSISRQKLIVLPNLQTATPYFRNDPDWYRGNWSMTGVASAGQGAVLVLLSQLAQRDQQSYVIDATFPTGWIQERRAEGYTITTVAQIHGSWWVIATRSATPVEQIVIGPSVEWPADQIGQQYNRRDVDMRITSFAHHDTHGFAVLMSAAPGQRQQWYAGWDNNAIQAKIKEGLARVQATSADRTNAAGNQTRTWYAVLTDAGKPGTYTFDEKQFPGSWISSWATTGYRIAWIF